MELKKIKKSIYPQDYRAQKKKVAAYVRVSSKFEKQTYSYFSQVEYYKEKIKKNANWNFVNVYADYGISGSSDHNRAGFLQLMNDALNGKVDLILTKSISRFSRNTVDTLKYIRMLRDIGVGVIFEENNINTLNLNNELILTLLSTMAQREVENLGMNISIGKRMSVLNGKITIQNRIYGYDNIDNKLYINKEEAKNIRKIFKLYCDGYKNSEIIELMRASKAKTIRDKCDWNCYDIIKILANRIYLGELRRGDRTDQKYLNVKNDEFVEREIIHITNHHEPIISNEVFEKAQEIRAKRYKESGFSKKSKNNSIIKDFIRCGFCGYKVSKSENLWFCNKKGKKYNGCYNSIVINNEILSEAFYKCCELLMSEKNMYDELFNKNSNITYKLNSEKDNYVREHSKLVNAFMRKKINKFTFSEKSTSIKKKIEEVDKKLNVLNMNFIKLKAIRKAVLNVKSSIIQLVLSKDEGAFEKLFQKIVTYIVLGGKTKENKENSAIITFIFKINSDIQFNRKNIVNYFTSNLYLDDNKFILLDYTWDKELIQFKNVVQDDNVIKKEKVKHKIVIRYVIDSGM